MCISIKTRLRHFLLHQWLYGGWLSLCLTPLAWLYGGLLACRRLLFCIYLKKKYRAPCPVIVVGNIFVGGTGKTPVTIALVQALQQKGYSPAVISRGYGTKIGAEPIVAYAGAVSNYPAATDASISACNATAEKIGDEPSLLAQYAPIAVHPKRALAAQALLKKYPQTNLIIADDGLQHLALARDIEIVVQDQRKIGNGRLLPAGPLRENAKRLQQVDFVITNMPSAAQLPTNIAVISRHDVGAETPPPSTPTDNTNADHGGYHADTFTPRPLTVTMHLLPTEFVHLVSGQRLNPSEWVEQFAPPTQNHSYICALAGIGSPQRFFNTLNNLGIQPQHTIAFTDHYAFTLEDLQAIPEKIILMTEKDAVKCLTFNDQRLWYVCVGATFTNPNFFNLIQQKITALTYT